LLKIIHIKITIACFIILRINLSIFDKHMLILNK
jgi:hypothetical protein